MKFYLLFFATLINVYTGQVAMAAVEPTSILKCVNEAYSGSGLNMSSEESRDYGKGSIN